MYHTAAELYEELKPMLSLALPGDLERQDLEQVLICLGAYFIKETPGVVVPQEFHSTFRPAAQTVLPGLTAEEALPWLELFGLISHQELTSGLAIHQMLARLKHYEVAPGIPHHKLVACAYILRYLPTAIMHGIPGKSFEQVLQDVKVRARKEAGGE